MRHSMVVEVRARRESLSTDGAFVRLFTGMDPSVCIERTGRGKSFEAHITGVRLFTFKTNADMKIIEQ